MSVDITGLEGKIGSATAHVVDTAIKLGHEIKDHQDEHHKKKYVTESDTGQVLSPFQRALSIIPQVAWAGIKVLVPFALIYAGVSFLTEGLIDRIPKESIWHAFAKIPLVIAPTAAIWFGGKGFFDAYSEFNEHNQSLIQGMKAKLTRGKTKELESERAPVEEMGTIAMGLKDDDKPVESPIYVTTTTGNSHSSVPDEIFPFANRPDGTEQAPNKRADFITDILNNGPKSFSPKDMAEQLKRSRSPSAEQAL